MAMSKDGRESGHLWAILQEHIDKQAYPPSRRQLAHRLGIAPQTLNNWHKGLTALPQREHLQAVAALTGHPYPRVLRAALLDAGYETEETLATRVTEAPSRDTDMA
jgi:transcriptional regulator with XRE-family HTH domain